MSADLRRRVAVGCRILANAGLCEDVLGHISVRIDDDTILVRSRGPHERGLLFTVPDDVRPYSLTRGAADEGTMHVPPNELPIHTACYRADPQVGAVVHAHPPAVVAADLAGIALVPMVGAYNIPAAALAAGGIALYPRGVLINTDDLGREMIAAMDGRPVCVLRGHGLTTTGASIEQAVARALAIDSLARMACQVAQLGAAPSALRADDLAQLPDLGSAFNDDLLWRHHEQRLELAGLGVAARVSPILDDIGAAIGTGMIPAYVYSDPDVFELERDRLFGATWVFLAHESEIPSPGDYVVRRVLDDSFIVVRDEHGTVRVHFNMCLHRGMQVCRAELGNASHFRCPYHGWSYRNDGSLAGLPFHQDAYGGDDGLRRADQHLLPPPRVDTVDGLIFASLAADGPTLAEHLGDFAFYLGFYTRQSADGLELRGPQRWRVRANWKIGCENFVGDMYHTPYTHRSVVDIGLFREPKANKRKEGVLYFAGTGGGTTYKLPPGDFRERMRYVGYPDEMIERAGSSWSAEQVAMVGDDGFMVSAATLFPNVSLVHNWPQVDDTGTVVPFISIRQWQPVSPTETEVLSWFAVDRNAPETFKRDSYRAYLMCFGSSGMFEQDDVENWVSITNVSRGAMARRLRLNSRMGLTSRDEAINQQVPGFSGPGAARVGYSEFNQRDWLTLWSSHLAGGTIARTHPLGRTP